MNREETAELLRARSALTSTPYGETAVGAWHAALAHLEVAEAKHALVRAARKSRTVTVADLLEQVPRRPAPTPRPAPAEEYLAPSDPRAIEAFELGLAQGRAELEEIRRTRPT